MGLFSSLVSLGSGYQRVKAEVLFWHGEGLTAADIADKLKLSRTIVETVVKAYREGSK